MANEKKGSKIGEDGSVTSSELEYILDVNKKAIEIHIEVEKQNEQILNSLEEIDEKLDSIVEKQREHLRMTEDGKKMVEDGKETIDEIKKLAEETHKAIKDEIEKKVEEIEKNLFRLVIILGSAGVGTLLTIVQAFLHK